MRSGPIGKGVSLAVGGRSSKAGGLHPYLHDTILFTAFGRGFRPWQEQMQVIINGEARTVAPGVTLEVLLDTLGIDRRKVAIERNLEIVPRSAYGATQIGDGDKLEIVHFIGGGSPGAETEVDADPLIVAGRRFRSRLIVGTGKYKDFAQNAAALRASGAEIVTVALRRVNVMEPGQPMLVDFIDPKEYTYLPNTAGCYTAEEAVRTLRLAREAGGWDLVKLEVLGDKKSLFPDMVETLKGAEMLIKEGFQVMVYCSDDPIMARRLEEIGCCAIMPLGAPIGSGLGIQNPVNIRLIVEQSRVPVIVDAGVGTASDATVAMELGCDGVLMNTAIAEAKDPVVMARAMRLAVESGRLAYCAGRMQKRRYADPSSPLAGMI
jgi:thiazole synthase